MNKSIFQRLLPVLVIVLLAGLCFHRPQPVLAETSSPQIYVNQSESSSECIPLDVLFLVDQTAPTNRADPGNMRLAIIQMFINLLGDDRLYHCNDVVHRVAVIDWDGEVILDLTPLNMNTREGVSAWNDFRNDIYNQLKPQTSTSRNYLHGLEVAAEILEPSLQNDPQRQQLIFMLGGNAGIPCANIYSCAHYWLTQLFQRELLAQIQADFPRKDGSGPLIYSITTDLDLKGFEDYREGLKNVLVENGGDAYIVDRPIDMVRIAMDIFKNIYPHTAVREASPGSFYIDPFTQKLNVYQIRSQENSFVRVSSPGNQTSANEGPSSELFQYSSIDHPVAGEWSLNADRDAVVYYELVEFIELHPQIINSQGGEVAADGLPQYDEPGEEWDSKAPYYLSFSAVDQFGKAYIEGKEYQSEINVSLSLPDGSAKQMSCPFVKDRYVCSDPLSVHLVGDYHWKMNLSSPIVDPQDSNRYLKINSEGAYGVKAVEAIKIVFDKPTRKSFPVHGYPFGNYFLKPQPISIRVHLTTVDGEEINVSRVINSNPNQSVLVELTNIKTQKVETVFLNQNANELATFEGEIGTEVYNPGDYYLEVKVDGTLNPLYRIARDPALMQIKRRDNILTAPGFYVFLLVLSILTVLGGIAFLAYTHTNPVKGSLEFYRAGSNMPFTKIEIGKRRRRKVVLPVSGNIDYSPILWHLEKMVASMDAQGIYPTVEFHYETGQVDTMHFDFNLNEDENLETAGQVKTTKEGKHLESELVGSIFVRYSPANE